jgi:multisubunit Na+/H+ antiporter MnhG subunit
MFDYILPVIIVGVIIFTFVTLLKRSDKFTLNHGPEVLTTIGIFGCFLGISYALWNLGSNANDLISNIPNLIIGLKTAFIGSTVGIACALGIRLKQYLDKNTASETKQASENATTADLVDAIRGLQKGLVGSEEGTLLTQIKLQRQETTDQLFQLRSSFDDFAKHMVENNQKAIIEALERVIKDFNEQLMSQFGENFKQLNSAVEKLVVWQAQYKDELNLIKATQQQTSEDMKNAADAFSQVVQRSSEFANTAEKLKELMEGLDKQKDLLFIQEKALSELLISMKDVTPQFAEKMNAMLIDLKNGVNEIQTNTKDVVKNFGEQIQSSTSELSILLPKTLKETQDDFFQSQKQNSDSVKNSVMNLEQEVKSMLDRLKDGANQIEAETQDAIKNYSIQIRETSAQLSELLPNVIKDTQRVFLDNLKDNSDVIKQSVVALDEGLTESLNKSLESLGKQLAALSEKFVADYLPLTESLRDVVRIAENIRK